MIVWIDGAFGAGKSTLARQLHRRLPEALAFDPQCVGAILVTSAPPAPSGDFQDLPLWRKLVADFVIGLADDYGQMLIVPMTLVNPHHRGEIFGLIKKSGHELLHVFLEVPADELRRRIDAQILVDDDWVRDGGARAFRHRKVERCVAARESLTGDTLVLRGDRHTPAGLADLVVAAIDDRKPVPTGADSRCSSNSGEAADAPEIGPALRSVRVVATTMLKADARARLSEQLGPGFVVLDLRKAPPSTDIVIAPVLSPQTISALKQMFPAARVVLTEIEDRDTSVSFPGPVQRAIEAGADGYVVAGDLAALAAFTAADTHLALNPGRPGQLQGSTVRSSGADQSGADESVRRELGKHSRRREIH
ncbi:hypothetical protein ABIB25_000513 [Nakamurella sp. UYEF19]|uniref:AAA family ATPase n=1 Tax=Nakamurella sp. UYEF19 TaxID=1756392 RepID=UPI0033948F14